jgi:hypothetical protein
MEPLSFGHKLRRSQQKTWGLTQFGLDHAKAERQTKITSAGKFKKTGGEAKVEGPKFCNDVG